MHGISALLNALDGLNIPGLRIPARAFGGPVSAGQPFLVGERGPELFVPPRTGRVVSNNQLAAAGAGGSSVTNNIQMTVNAKDADSFRRSEDQILKGLNRRLVRAERRR